MTTEVIASCLELRALLNDETVELSMSELLDCCMLYFELRWKMFCFNLRFILHEIRYYESKLLSYSDEIDFDSLRIQTPSVDELPKFTARTNNDITTYKHILSELLDYLIHDALIYGTETQINAEYERLRKLIKRSHNQSHNRHMKSYGERIPSYTRPAFNNIDNSAINNIIQID